VSSEPVLFFDDYPRTPENVLFVWRLRLRLREFGSRVVREKSIHRLEARLRSGQFVALVLDIMAAMPDENDKDALAGLHILRGCRNGNYSLAARELPVYMRTARGEMHVRREAAAIGANGYFLAGTDDSALIEVLIKLVRGSLRAD